MEAVCMMKISEVVLSLFRPYPGPARDRTATLPALGDARKRYVIELTEPEINTIAASIAFVSGFLNATGELQRWMLHYGPTIKSLDAKFAPFEDGNAPYRGEGPRDLRSAGESSATAKPSGPTEATTAKSCKK